MYPLHEPTFSGREQELVRDCLESTFVSSVGAYVDEMERELERLTGAARAVVVVNGTAAIEVSLRVVGVGPGDLVITPSLTFVATANAIRHAGAVPAFLDVEAESLGLDPQQLRDFLGSACQKDADGRWIHQASGRRVAAVVAVHIFGNPAHVDTLAAICDEAGIPLVEDAAESLASRIGDVHTGLFGRCGAVSFNGNKIVTTGGGGALLTMDDALGERVKHLTTTAKRPHRWEYWHTEWAYNYRMPNLNAALGVAQMRDLPGLLERKARVHQAWLEAFEGSGATLLEARPGTTANHWLAALVLPASTTLEQRNALLDAACDERILCRPIWVPLHQLPAFADAPRGSLEVTASMHRRVVNLPSTAHLVDSSAGSSASSVS